MEMRAFFAKDTAENVLMSDVKVEPSRSPFMRARLAVQFEASTVDELCERVTTLELGAQTYRVVSLNDVALRTTEKW